MNEATNTTHPVADTRPEIAFDLADYEDVQSAEIHLKKGGEPIPVYVTVAGPEHPKRKAHLFATMRKKRAEIFKAGKLIASDPAEDESDDLDTLCLCVLGWRGVVLNGQALACTAENVRAVLTDPKRAWFRKAVKSAVEDTEAFTVASATS